MKTNERHPKELSLEQNKNLHVKTCMFIKYKCVVKTLKIEAAECLDSKKAGVALAYLECVVCWEFNEAETHSPQ